MKFAREGFIVAYQGVHGRFMSNGELDDMRPHLPDKVKTDVDESTGRRWDRKVGCFYYTQPIHRSVLVREAILNVRPD